MGSSSYGKGDTSRSGLRGDQKGGGYQITKDAPKSAPGKTRNLAGRAATAPAPTVAPGKVDIAFAENRGKQPPWGSMVSGNMYRYHTKPYALGDYAAYRKTLPGFVAAMKGKKPSVLPPVAVAKKAVAKPTVKPAAQVISTTTNEKLSPAPARMAVNARTGNTTGFTTGKTTGTSASKPGVAGKTYASSYSRQMANAMNRTNQPAGPMGGGGGRIGGGTSPSRSGGGGTLGGARGRIGEPGGSKR